MVHKILCLIKAAISTNRLSCSVIADTHITVRRGSDPMLNKVGNSDDVNEISSQMIQVSLFIPRKWQN